MKLGDIVEKLELEQQWNVPDLDVDVTRGYASDMLSDVLAGAREGDIWVTLQIHPNTVAVASIKGVAAIVLVNGRKPEEETLTRAEQENVPLYVSALSAFELVGRLYAMGISGTGNDAVDA